MLNKLVIYMALVLMAVGFVGPAAQVLANSADLKINLVADTGFRGAKGTAKFRDRGGEREFQVEVEARLLANSKLTVWVNDSAVGTIDLDAFGRGRLNRNSRLGQTVPTIAPGTLIGVTNAQGNIVLAGKF